MKITFKAYEKLPLEAKYIRNTVFVLEQGFVDEFDENDEKAIHILMFDYSKAIGTARIIFSAEHNCYMIGRFAVLKEYRNKKLGQKMMRFTEEEIVRRFGHIFVGVSSQEQASEFYKKVGFSCTDERYLDQDCPHVFMSKKL